MKKSFLTLLLAVFLGGGTLSATKIKFVSDVKLLKNLSGTIGQLALVQNDSKIYRYIYNGKEWLPLTKDDGPRPWKVDFFGDGSGVALYTFDGNTKDSGGKYDAIGHNIHYTTGIFGKAIDYTSAGPDSYIRTIKKIIRNNKDITISGWINVSGHTGNYLSIWLSDMDDNGNSKQLALWMSLYDNSRFYIRNDSTYKNNDGISISNGKITYNKWHHIVQVVTSTQMRFYIDGILTDTISRNYFKKYDGYFYIGDRWYHKNHLIDQVRIFNRALNASEINKLYHE